MEPVDNDEVIKSLGEDFRNPFEVEPLGNAVSDGDKKLRPIPNNSSLLSIQKFGKNATESSVRLPEDAFLRRQIIVYSHIASAKHISVQAISRLSRFSKRLVWGAIRELLEKKLIVDLGLVGASQARRIEGKLFGIATVTKALEASDAAKPFLDSPFSSSKRVFQGPFKQYSGPEFGSSYITNHRFKISQHHAHVAECLSVIVDMLYREYPKNGPFVAYPEPVLREKMGMWWSKHEHKKDSEVRELYQVYVPDGLILGRDFILRLEYQRTSIGFKRFENVVRSTPLCEPILYMLEGWNGQEPLWKSFQKVKRLALGKQVFVIPTPKQNLPKLIFHHYLRHAIQEIMAYQKSSFELWATIRSKSQTRFLTPFDYANHYSSKEFSQFLLKSDSGS